MARILWNVLCTKASIDKNTNNISLFDIIEELTFLGPEPTERVLVPCTVDFVILSERTDLSSSENPNARVRLLSPKGDAIALASIKIDLGEFLRCRSIFHMDRIPLEGTGRYQFNVEFLKGENWEKQSEMPLTVKFVQEPPAPAAVS